ncbi:MAG TPA: epoxide hydrolase [Kutzneria sp.]|nr:epoxide hydrolase [Kutzneria sp.]
MSEHSRRTFLAASAGAVAATGLAATPALAAEDTNSAIRRFRVNVPQRDLDDLHKRLAATKWPSRETVGNRDQGVQLDAMRSLIQHWQTKYDWRKLEARLNALPQFITTVDGLDIHFLHIRSKHADALPMIITHGWPGSILEMLKVIGPLTDPTRHGGSAADAFHLVIPSMPGYGFSGKPTGTGWNPDRMARAWQTLMARLDYQHYVSQGGDWGSVVSDVLAKQKPPGLLGIHVTMPATVPPEIARILQAGDPPPAGLAPDELAAFHKMNALYTRGSGYAGMMVTRPQTLGYSLADSPVGLAAWMYDKFADWTYSGGVPERSLTRDEMLDDISLYWLTGTANSASQLYYENNANNFNAVDISVPAAITVFPGEIYQAPRSWAERAYHNLVYYNKVDKGGHFAAWEEPALFTSEVRAAFRFLRH